MLHTRTKATTYRTGLTGVRRVDKLHPDTGSFGLVGDKRLQLRPCPAVQPGSHTFATFDPFADVGQLLHGDSAASVSCCFCDNSLTDFVIHVSDMAGFAAGDFLQQLTCRLRAVALKPPTKGKKSVAVISQSAAIKQLAGADGGDGVFAKVHAKDGTGVVLRNIRQVKDQVKEKAAFPTNQLCFLRKALVEEPLLELPDFHRHDNAPVRGEQGNGVASDGVRPFVKMDGAALPKADHRPVGLSQVRIVRQERAVRLRYRRHGVASHLRTQVRHLGPHQIVPLVMQAHPITDTLSGGHACQQVAGTGKLRLQGRHQLFLLRRGRQFDADGSLHLPPALDVFGTLDVALNRLGTHVTGSADVIGGGPQVSTVQAFLQLRKGSEQLSGGDSFQKLYRSGYSARRRDGYKKMDVVRLDLQGKNFPAMPDADFFKYVLQSAGDFPG